MNKICDDILLSADFTDKKKGVKALASYGKKAIPFIQVANKANLREKTKRHAIRMMMDEVTKKQMSAGKNPMGFVATILYLSCLETGENKTQTDIAAAGVTDVTIRNRYKELKSK